MAENVVLWRTINYINNVLTSLIIFFFIFSLSLALPFHNKGNCFKIMLCNKNELSIYFRRKKKYIVSALTKQNIAFGCWVIFSFTLNTQTGWRNTTTETHIHTHTHIQIGTIKRTFSQSFHI
jgi:hypothetical protein